MRKVASQTTVPRGVVSRLERWFPAVLRDLPWRRRRSPWRVLVSEVMLQQTQAARVAQRYSAFTRRFPTPRRLAEASEREVLAAWQGLGYYRRARLLRAAAQAIVRDHGGRVPGEESALLSLPGIGRYTAGAVASIAFGRAAPIVDGNVARVLLRLADRRDDPRGAAALAWLWSEAERLVRAARSPAVFNEALMELGATVCVPRSPRCGECPLRSLCAARRAGSQELVPLTRSPAPRRRVVHHALAEIRGGRLGVEARPGTGLWAGMLSPPVVEANRVRSAAQLLRLRGDLREIAGLAGQFDFATTHRAIQVRVYHARFHRRAPLRWIALESLARHPVSNAVLRIARVAADG
jgi:A/G-specific adenine glycosylase